MMTELAAPSARELDQKKLLAAQLYIQNNLAGDLSLSAVAHFAGASRWHFHRRFKAQMGETIKQYADRLRVEKSIYDIHISELNLLQIALRYGFKNAETYSRVFKKYIGQRPSDFLRRRRLHRNRVDSSSTAVTKIESGLRGSTDANFSVIRLAELHLAFIRHIGPYQNVPLIAEPGQTIWRELQVFAIETLQIAEPLVYIGIPQDSPATTAPEKQRFDACLVVDKPFDGQGEIGYQKISGGYYAVLTHAGPYATLAEAYTSLFELASRLKRFTIVPGALFELLLNISATSVDQHTWTELYLPLQPRGTVS